MRPDCERCGANLPAESAGAFICSFECTFCAACAEAMDDICPNCGGELVDRPNSRGAAPRKQPAGNGAPVQGMSRPPRVLVIAGSDSSGGAGIQADIKTITMLGGYAMTAITAVTAQNTRGVQAVETLSPELVAAQIDACLGDIGADAVKIGMLGSADIAEVVADRLEDLGKPIVFDPVMVATSGARWPTRRRSRCSAG